VRTASSANAALAPTSPTRMKGASRIHPAFVDHKPACKTRARRFLFRLSLKCATAFGKMDETRSRKRLTIFSSGTSLASFQSGSVTVWIVSITTGGSSRAFIKQESGSSRRTARPTPTFQQAARQPPLDRVRQTLR
jgi:hypothetical protein